MIRFLAKLGTLCAICIVPIHAQHAVHSILWNDHYTHMQTNTIGLWMSNNGVTAHNPQTDGSGCEYPLGSRKYLIFSDGFVFGGWKGDELHVGGATYRVGYQAGRIGDNGWPTDPFSPENHIFRTRRMTRTEYDALPVSEQAQLQSDFTTWPIADGAPWVDADGDGSYTPNFYAWLDGRTDVDAPRILGREMYWYAANDGDAMRTTRLYGTLPMDVEVRFHAWAWDTPGVLSRTIFHRLLIINRSATPITDFHIGRWSDPDLGDGGDDLVGVDSVRSLAYVYNGKSTDAVYGTAPAAGYLLLQGPSIIRPGATGTFNLTVREGIENLAASAFAFYINGDTEYSDPTLGSPDGAVAMYKFLRGTGTSGRPFFDPVRNVSTAFPLSGNPVLGTNWIDGTVHKPGDRRMLLSTGPITLAPGDTQEVVYAFLVADSADGTTALGRLFEDADSIRTFHTRLVTTTTAPPPNPTRIALQLPHPHPVRDHATLTVDLPRTMHMRLTLHDALGRMVMTVWEGTRMSGSHRIPLALAPLPPGHYHCRLVTAEATATRTIIVTP
jgi:hypothetical protein